MNLVFMDIPEWKCICRALLCIEADRNALYHPDIVDGGILLEISPLSESILTGVIGVGIFCMSAKFFSVYNSLVRLTSPSKVEPRNPLEFHVGMLLCFLFVVLYYEMLIRMDFISVDP